MKTPQQMAEAWATSMASPTTSQRYKDGINAFNGNPMALAAAPDALQRYQNGVAQAVASGRMAAALNGANVGDWKNNALTVGAQRLAGGGTKGKAKALRAYTRLAPIYAQMRSTVQGMPKGGLAAAQARSNAALAVLMQATGKA